MKAIVMAGGKGSRMNLPVEKPLIKLLGRELIFHVISALHASRFVDSITAITSPSTPETENRLKINKISFLRGPGDGYVRDMQWAIATLRIEEPVVVCSADIVFSDQSLVDELIELYNKSAFPALTVGKLTGCDIEHLGFNILDGRQMDGEQKEVIVLLNEDRLINVNTVEDLKKAEDMLGNRDERC